MSEARATPRLIAICQHPGGEGVWWEVEKPEGDCIQQCDCEPVFYRLIREESESSKRIVIEGVVWLGEPPDGGWLSPVMVDNDSLADWIEEPFDLAPHSIPHKKKRLRITIEELPDGA